ncbi:MAG: AtpZ/AtpI family protein [Sandaracinaceae bacterium]
MSEDPTAAEVARKAERIRRGRDSRGTWRHLAQVGVLGWGFILPVIACAWLGHWVAERTGTLWPAVVGVLAGLGIGGFVVWRSVRDSLDEEPPSADRGEDDGGA